MMTSCRKEALVGGDAKSIDLGLGMLNRSRADSGQGLPKSSKCLSTLKVCNNRSRLRKTSTNLMVWSYPAVAITGLSSVGRSIIVLKGDSKKIINGTCQCTELRSCCRRGGVYPSQALVKRTTKEVRSAPSFSSRSYPRI
jgi:hypothetical protein